MNYIDINLSGYEQDPISGLSAALKIAQLFKKSFFITFKNTGIKIVVSPESYISDLKTIFDLEYEMYKLKNK